LRESRLSRADPPRENVIPQSHSADFNEQRKENGKESLRDWITSTAKGLKKLNQTSEKIRLLTDSEAVELCKKSLKNYRDSTKEVRRVMIPEIQWLCSCLENHPIAITQAVAYLNRMTGVKSIADFIENYEKNVMVFQKKEEQVGGDYSHSVATVFYLTMDLIGKTDSALEMLYFLSFYSESATPVELFEILYGETVTRKAVAALERLHLASSVQRVRVARLAASVDDDSPERHSALHQLQQQLASLDYDDDPERNNALRQLAQQFLSVQNESDEDGTECIFVHRTIQKVVQDLVLERIELMEVIFQAAFIVETGSDFPVIETLKENHQNVDFPECNLNKIFVHHWELVQTNEAAASAVMMTAFCRLNEVFPWGVIFGRKKWADACSVLERTCFRSLLLDDDDFVRGFHSYVDLLIVQLTVVDKDKLSVLLNSITLALESFKDASKWPESNLTTSRREGYIITLEKKQQEIKVIVFKLSQYDNLIFNQNNFFNMISFILFLISNIFRICCYNDVGLCAY